jgi:hypothetical protein
VPYLKLVALWAVPRSAAPVAFLIATNKLARTYDTATRARLANEIDFRQLLDSTEGLLPFFSSRLR